jgi:branched-chain amino acid transport system permease protein
MFFQQLANGLAIGSIYSLVAIGYSMVYGVLGLINFANNAFMIGGAYLLILFFVWNKFPVWITIILSLGLCGLGAMAMERFSLRYIRKVGSSEISSLICTVGYSTLILNLEMIIFGSQTNPIPSLFNFDMITIGNVMLDPLQIIILGMAVIMMVILSYVTYSTKTGDAMRAISQNMQAAHLMGIKVNNIINLTFFIGTVCTALSGIMIGVYYGAVDTGMAFSVGIKTFAAAVLGGIGSLPGSMVGGIIIGIIETFVVSYISAGYRDAISFIILIVVLVVRPSGLFGKKQITKV